MKYAVLETNHTRALRPTISGEGQVKRLSLSSREPA